jgi:DNA polymerase-1
MHHLVFTPHTEASYPVALLVPVIQAAEIRHSYLTGSPLSPSDVLVLDLYLAPDKKKTPMNEMRAYFTEEVIPTLNDMKVEYLLVADAEYFKAITKKPKADAYLGYATDSPYGPWKVFYIPNYRQIFYDPEKVKPRIAAALEALDDHRAGQYSDPGNGIIRFVEYPQTTSEIAAWLEKLLEWNRPLAIDIETFSLKHHTAGIGTISFCWSQHEGIAFPVDYRADGVREYNEEVRILLHSFFTRYTAKAIYHGASFDVYVLIAQLFMRDLLDTAGLLKGLSIMLRNYDCTKLITYLATNSCAGNKLGLKDQSQEFAGNYAKEGIADITKIPLKELLEYNLVDGLSTWYVHNKHWGTVQQDDQLTIYETLFKPALIDIIQMQLTGMPIDMNQVRETKALLVADEQQALKDIFASRIIEEFIHTRNEQWVAAKNLTLKKKRVTLADATQTFNPNSPDQLQQLLFEQLELPILGYTDTKQPSTDGDTLTALMSHTKNPTILALLQNLIDFKAVGKLLSSFIPAFENAVPGPDGWHYLFGNFNLGGTVSGRLSSSDPNLQNIPSSNSKGRMALYVKLIKACFKAPPGWLFCGLDFNSLEDKISALTTKDPNKIKVYTDGYDGDSLRAHAYFGKQMPDIDPTSVTSINSIAKFYPDFRQKSKDPTFALTYQGTFRTLMKNCGFSLEIAKNIEQQYQQLYAVSIAWVNARLDQASITGYIVGAFGLRVRTPLLKQVVRGISKTPFEAEAEGRTAGNALGQSYCLLNTRAGVEFNQKVRASEFKFDIKPSAHIHDAQYFVIRDDIDVLMFTNEHLVKAVQWQDDPEIYHDQVKLGGELSIFYPHWGKEITLPNGATVETIREIVAKACA